MPLEKKVENPPGYWTVTRRIGTLLGPRRSTHRLVHRTKSCTNQSDTNGTDPSPQHRDRLFSLGLWIIPIDLEELSRLFSRNDGWIFVIPIELVVADIYLTLIGLSQGNWELNPFVASAVQIGPWAVVPFVVSYMALSEGLALGMLSIGKWLFGVVRQSRFVPFALICGAASFGPLSNTELLAFPGAGPVSYFVGMIIGMIALSVAIFLHFKRLS